MATKGVFITLGLIAAVAGLLRVAQEREIFWESPRTTVLPALLETYLEKLPGRRQESRERLRQRIVRRFLKKYPRQWGTALAGIKTKLKTKGKYLALTFDACGGRGGDGYNSELIHYLQAAHIPATLFVSGTWIENHQQTLKQLARNPLFEIENHGLHHKPCSVTGRSAYGIRGTRSVAEAVDEIELNARTIERLIHRKPRYYRSATAYCDDIGLEIARALGYEVVNFNVQGDAGATYSRRQVKQVLLHAVPGSIVIFHMNHPGSGTAAGLREAIPLLKRRGFSFVKLADSVTLEEGRN